MDTMTPEAEALQVAAYCKLVGVRCSLATDGLRIEPTHLVVPEMATWMREHPEAMLTAQATVEQAVEETMRGLNMLQIGLSVLPTLSDDGSQFPVLAELTQLAHTSLGWPLALAVATVFPTLPPAASLEPERPRGYLYL